MERLTLCVEACQTAKNWLRKANRSIETALWQIKYGTFDRAEMAFRDGVSYLTKASELSGEDEKKWLY